MLTLYFIAIIIPAAVIALSALDAVLQEMITETLKDSKYRQKIEGEGRPIGTYSYILQQSNDG